ncbi:transmembrane emp24 domain-containing protein p24delta3, partial [Phtheirospermum japonicum]
VSSPHGNELHHNEKVGHGKFAFTSTESGSYLACFWVDGQQSGRKVTVGLDWKTGLATKDWESIAKKEKIEGLDLELRKLEDVVEHIHDKMIHMMSSEMQMRRVNDETNARVARYSVMSLGLCVLVSVLQLWYLRRYFQRKKLI